jgi:hypothetical protein
MFNGNIKEKVLRMSLIPWIQGLRRDTTVPIISIINLITIGNVILLVITYISYKHMKTFQG